MFPRLLKLVNQLVPAKVTHGWNIYKTLAAFAALTMIMALVPLPKDLPFTHAAADYTVDSSLDESDATPGDTLCVSTPGGVCTLRAAIEEANANGGSKTIDFDTGVFASQQTIFLTIGPLEISANNITIDGIIDTDEVMVVLDGSGVPDLSGVDGDKNACTTTDSFAKTLAPILRITGNNNTVYGLSFINARGNAIEIVDGDDNKINSNWIGTKDRTSDPDGNGLHGVCVFSETEKALGNKVQGNIIVASGNDGIRLEGRYKSGTGTLFVENSDITNNLIGNQRATDPNDDDAGYHPGNTYSGITSKVSENNVIAYNVITNNGEADGVPAGDGITLLESGHSFIAENIIGTFQPAFADRGIEDQFPLPLDGGEHLLIASVSPTAGIGDYDAAPNACDGIGMRFNDHLVFANGSGSIFVGSYQCPDDTGTGSLLGKPNADNSTYFGAEVGPSVDNAIIDNEIGFNERNGVYIQSVACYNDDEDNHFNLPNTMVGTPVSATSQYFTQSAQNSIVQNSIFLNDGTSTYGIGIDLEDHATATLFTPAQVSDLELVDYWTQDFLNYQQFNCANSTFPVIDGAFVPKDDFQPAPVNVLSQSTDPNITENDDYNNEPNDNAGFDPDAGANRLINHPFIVPELSTPNNIVVRGAKGSWVDIYQVICTSGIEGDTVPDTDAGIRATCDTDYWNKQNGVGVQDNHTKGHGQGFRYLGSGYIRTTLFDPDSEGTVTIRPSDFFLNDSNPTNDVATFDGGLVVATDTGFKTSTLCWDVPSDPSCSAQEVPVVVAPAGVHAERAGSVGAFGLWFPSPISTDETGCDVVNEELTPRFISIVAGDFNPEMLALLGCLGSTSEFSPAEFVGEPLYTLEKTQDTSGPITPDSDVTYTITLTNTGTTLLDISAGALSDVLPTTVIDSIVSCSYVIVPDVAETPCVPGALPDPLIGTGFPSIPPGAVITITIVVHVASNPNECSFHNEIIVTGEPPILGPNFEIATETGSFLHQTPKIDIAPCTSTGTGSSTLEKQVSVNGGTFVDADSPGPSALDVSPGDTIDYSIHYGNQTESGATVTTLDAFPPELGGTITAVTCWINGTAGDNTLGADTALPCEYDPVSQQFDADDSTSVDDPFNVPTGQYLHILITGFNIVLTTPDGPVCNTADATVTETTEFLTDNACVDMFHPVLNVAKFVLANGSETTFNSGLGAPSVNRGDALTYYIDVSNTANAVLNGLAVTDVLPVGLNSSGLFCTWNVLPTTPLITHEPTITYSNGCNLVGTTVTGIPASMGAFTTIYISLSNVSVDSSALVGSFCNQVQAAADNLSDSDNACLNVQVPSQPNLSIIKTVSNSTPNPGSTITYTLQVTNNGSASVNNVQVVDDLGDAADDVIPRCVSSSADILSTSGGISSTVVGNVVTWTIGTLAVSSTTTVSVNVRLRSDLVSGTTCRNIATAFGTGVTSVQDDATINIPTTVGQTTVTLDKEATNDNGGIDDPDVFELGDTVKYQVTVRNTGSASISNLNVRDSIPKEEENLDNVTTTTGTVNASELSADQLRVDGMSIPAGGLATIDYETSVLNDNDFPLDNYDLDSGANQDDSDFYPENVESDDIGTSSSYDSADDALDAPDGQFVSLGEDGQITLETSHNKNDTGKLIVDGNGDDFCVLEVDPSLDSDATTEEYEVEVSQTKNDHDFESVGHSTSNSDCFDLGDANMTWARFIRITETSSHVSGSAPGSDIDAVCLLNLGGFVDNTAGLYNGSSLITTADERVLVDFTNAFDNALEAKDCREQKELRVPTPLPPVPVPPYIPPVQIPSVPFYGLPKTGPEAAAVPMIATGLAGMIAWAVRRRKK